VVRNLTLDEVRHAVDAADLEGWEPGLTDADAFYAADPEGFFGLELDGRIVATISAVRCSDRVTFLGFYIVSLEDRGEGYGKRLWDEVLGRSEASTLAGDAVPEQLTNYESEGFAVAHRNARFTLAQAPDSVVECEKLVEAIEVEFDRLVEFDGAHCFGPRPEFLSAWIEGDGRDAMVMVGDDGEILGFAASRKTSIGHRIGPVFCREAAQARALITTLARRVGGAVSVDIPLSNAEAVSLCAELGMVKSFETARIYRGEVPKLPLTQVFGITSLELG
jgi:hypothetical protein